MFLFWRGVAAASSLSSCNVDGSGCQEAPLCDVLDPFIQLHVSLIDDDGVVRSDHVLLTPEIHVAAQELTGHLHEAGIPWALRRAG